MISMGKEVNLEELTRAVEARDQRDSTRAASPLQPAEDAVLVDNSDMDEAETLARVLEIVQGRYQNTVYN